jgi:hypothetical protein
VSGTANRRLCAFPMKLSSTSALTSLLLRLARVIICRAMPEIASSFAAGTPKNPR